MNSGSLIDSIDPLKSSALRPARILLISGPLFLIMYPVFTWGQPFIIERDDVLIVNYFPSTLIFASIWLLLMICAVLVGFVYILINSRGHVLALIVTIPFVLLSFFPASYAYNNWATMRIGSDEIELLRPFAKYSWKFNRMRGWDFVERRGVRIGIDHVLCFSLEGSPTGAEEFVTVALTPTIESMQFETMSETLRRYMHAPQIVIPNCG